MTQSLPHNRPIAVIIAVALCALCGAGLFASTHRFATADAEPGHRTPLEQPAKGTAKYTFDYSWSKRSPFVAHAMGSIDGHTYTNSRDAFIRNYELGHRVFEVDLCLTNDNRTVLAHDALHWRNNASLQAADGSYSDPAEAAEFTYDNFMASRWHGTYRPLDLEALLQLMKKYPDAYILIDGKYYDQLPARVQFTELVNTAKAIDPTVLDRIIVSVYTPEMLDVLMEIYPWKSAVCSIYRQAEMWSPEKIRLFLQDTGIEMVCMNGAVVTDSLVDMWAAEGAQILPFTINTAEEVEALKQMGITNFITDSLTPGLRPIGPQA